MCGIYGQTGFVEESHIRERLRWFSHRGPDAQRVLQLDGVSFGHNRLSILDLDERSHQPFQRDGDMIAFNGEIYNFAEIKQRLISRGVSFDTSSDTEVLLRAYQLDGAEVVDQLNGMFAFVIYDHKKRVLFGARDRFGKKPFYYRLKNGEFSFSSNLYSLCEKADTINPAAREQFFWFGHVPGGMSIVNGVNKLQPSHAFEFDLRNGDFRTWIYWKHEPKDEGLTEAIYSERLSELLADAVRIRLVADVPVGVFLSGGVDSTLVTKYAAQNGTSIKTFSIRFGESRFDESAYAEEAARKLGTQHTTIPCDVSDMYEMVENFPTFFDEPFADASAVPSMLLAKKTREHVTVALSGDGGDEIFYGYTRYRWFHWIGKLFSLPENARKALIPILKTAFPERRRQWEYLLNAKTREQAYVRFMGSLHGLMNEPSEIFSSSMHLDQHHRSSFIHWMSDWDVANYLPDDILTKVDRATMAFSLEARSPLLDYRIAELTRSQPLSFNFSAREGKKTLKRLLLPEFGSEFINRKKQGFTLPLKDWFRTSLKSEVLHWVYESDTLEQLGLHDVQEFRKQVEAHMNGTTNFYPEIWKLMVYGRWKHHFDSLMADMGETKRFD